MGGVAGFNAFDQNIRSADVLQKKVSQLAAETVRFSRTMGTADAAASGFSVKANQLAINLSKIEKEMLQAQKAFVLGGGSSDVFEAKMVGLRDRLKQTQVAIDANSTSMINFAITERDVIASTGQVVQQLTGLQQKIGILGFQGGKFGTAQLKIQLALVKQISATIASQPQQTRNTLERENVAILKQQLGIKEASSLLEIESILNTGLTNSLLIEQNAKTKQRIEILSQESVLLSKNLQINELVAASKAGDLSLSNRTIAVQQILNTLKTEQVALEKFLIQATGLETKEKIRLQTILKSITVELEKQLALINGAVTANKKLASGTQTVSRFTVAGFGKMIASQAVWIAGFAAMFAVLNRVKESISFIIDEQNEAARAFRVLRLTPGGRGDNFLGIDVERERKILKDVIQPMVSEKMRQSVVETGQSFKDLGEIFFQLGSAGLTAGEQFAAFRGTLRTIIATEGDVRETTKLVAGIFNTLFKNVDDGTSIFEKFERINNVIVKVFQDHQVELDELRNGYKFLATTANIAGFSFEEISGILAVLNDNLIKSGTAGRSMQTVLSRISRDFGKVIKDFGLASEEFDSTLPLAAQLIKILDQLKIKFGTTALDVNQLAIIFRDLGLRGARSFAVLVANADELKKIIGDLSDTQGIARVAVEMERLKLSTPERTFAKLGATISDILGQSLKPLVDVIVSIANAFASLSPTTREFISTVISLTIALGALVLIWKGLNAVMLLSAGATALSAGAIGIGVASIIALGAALKVSGVFSSKLEKEIESLSKRFAELDKIPINKKAETINELFSDTQKIFERVTKSIKELQDEQQKFIDTEPSLRVTPRSTGQNILDEIRVLALLQNNLKAILILMTNTRKAANQLGQSGTEIDRFFASFDESEVSNAFKSLFKFDQSGFEKFMENLNRLNKLFIEVRINSNSFAEDDLPFDIEKLKNVVDDLGLSLVNLVRKQIELNRSLELDKVKRFGFLLEQARKNVDAINKRIDALKNDGLDPGTKGMADLRKELQRLIVESAKVDKFARAFEKAILGADNKILRFLKSINSVILRLDDLSKKASDAGFLKLGEARITAGIGIDVGGDGVLNQNQRIAFQKKFAANERDINKVITDREAQLRKIEIIRVATLERINLFEKKEGISLVTTIARKNVLEAIGKAQEGILAGSADRARAAIIRKVLLEDELERTKQIAAIQLQRDLNASANGLILNTRNREEADLQAAILDIELRRQQAMVDFNNNIGPIRAQIFENEKRLALELLRITKERNVINREFDALELESLSLRTAGERELAKLVIDARRQAKLIAADPKKDPAQKQLETLKLQRKLIQNIEDAQNNLGKLQFDAAQTAGEAWEGAIDSIGDGFRTELARTKDIAGEFANIFRKAFDDIRSLGVKMFEDIFDKGLDSFEDFADSLKTLFKRLAAQIAATLIFRPIINSVQAGFGSILGGGGGGTVFGGGGNAFGGSGFGGAAGISGNGGLGLSNVSGISTSIGIGNQFFAAGSSLGFNAGVAALGDSISNFFSGVPIPGTPSLLGDALGAAGSVAGLAGGFAGNFLANQLFGEGRGSGQQVGAAVGGAAGAFGGAAVGALALSLGPVGIGIAALIGAFGGNFIGGLFGNSDDGKTGRKISREGQADIEKAAAEIFGALGIDTGLASGPSGVGNLFNNAGERGQPGLFGVELFDFGIKRGIIASGLADTTNDAAAFNEVLERINFKDAAQGIDDVRFALAFFSGAFDFEVDPAEKLTAGEQVIQVLTDRFEELIQQARRLGLAEQVVIDARNKVLENLRTEGNRKTELAILAIIDPLEFALQQIVDAQKIRLRDAKALGLNIADVERLGSLERQRVLDEFALRSSEFVLGIQSSLGQFTGSLEIALRVQEKINEDRLAQARLFGIELNEIEQLNSFEREQIIRDHIGNLNEEIEKFLEDLNLSDISPLSGREKLDLSQDKFQKLISDVLAGRDVAEGDLTSAARQLLDSAREFFASSPEFFNIFDQVQGLLRTVQAFQNERLQEELNRAGVADPREDNAFGGSIIGVDSDGNIVQINPDDIPTITSNTNTPDGQNEILSFETSEQLLFSLGQETVKGNSVNEELLEDILDKLTILNATIKAQQDAIDLIINIR